MGHKVNPNGFRLGISTHWTSNWYAERGAYGDTLQKDMEVRAFLAKRLAQASVSRIQIDRPAKSARIIIHTARPGIVIGKKGEDIEKLKHEVAKIIGLSADSVHLSVEEIRKPELDAKLIADSVAQQLERRIMFRRAMKRAVQNAMRLGAGGIKIQVSGRLNGAEIARTEWYREGRVPLHTLRAHVDYAVGEARTTYGIIGVKVWVFTGEVFDTDRRHDRKDETSEAAAA
ncbi:MAG: 30S ribosomal protein S3 [Nevskiales bacterium]|nr:30S ribosomal protein S3 [Nevskiales bacterium]